MGASDQRQNDLEMGTVSLDSFHFQSRAKTPKMLTHSIQLGRTTTTIPPRPMYEHEPQHAASHLSDTEDEQTIKQNNDKAFLEAAKKRANKIRIVGWIIVILVLAGIGVVLGIVLSQK